MKQTKRNAKARPPEDPRHRRADRGARALEILDAAGDGRIHVVAARDMRVMREYAALLRALAPDLAFCCLPEWDCLPCDHVSPSLAIMGERAGTLRWIGGDASKPSVVLTTVPALCQRVPPPEVWAGAHLEIRPGEAFDPAEVAVRLKRIGYVREERVDEPGQFALHGKTVDIFPAAATWPCRIDHENGEVREIRSYDVDTQRSLQTCDVLIVDAASEIVVTDETVERPQPFCGEEHHLARYYDRLVAVSEYLPGAPLLLDPEVEERVALFFDQVEEGCGLSEGRASGLHLSPRDWDAVLGSRETTRLSSASRDVVPPFHRDRHPASYLRRFLRQRCDQRDIVLLTGEGAPFNALIAEGKRVAKTPVRLIAGWREVAEAKPGDVLALPSPLRAGFCLTERGVTIVSAADFAGEDALRARDTHRTLPMDLTTLSIGDVAVDRDNGLCVFEGLETVTGAAGEASEAVRLRFADGNCLMLPVEQADRIWRYGSEPDAVTLDRLGGSAWSRRRIEVEASIAKTARALTAAAKQRATARTAPVLPDLDAMEQFAAGFRFNATPDQAAVIDEVLADLASETPMDRLVCGDVGYGKTEIALRAIAAAVFAGRQAVLMAPTTILARQHAETLRRRFGRFGIDVGVLSRLTPKAEAARVRKGLADGSLKVVVGTHAVSGKGVAFADLALTVIDEEQRFGTTVKSKLRSLGGDAAQPGHVLTLTATPIPRTLQGALSGLHALSLLTTPPAARQPIRTLVRGFDAATAAEALLRERARGGQSFVVCPRIEDLEPMAATLSRAAPDLEIVAAHGKLKAAEMDERIVRFADGKGDVLLATSIIESGLDIPRANTMIVHHADRFGLAELHQLRGRVGRGQRRGVVHLTTDPDQPLSPTAEKRLASLAKLDRLGSGFAIAGRDLDLRGAGDLVGEEQAGHVQKIGIGLYQHLLEMALAAAAGTLVADWSPDIAIGPTGRLPEDFVPDPETRLALYTRLFRARRGEEIDAWREELADRFGSIPTEVEQLARFARLRAACRRLGIVRLVAGPEGIAADLSAAAGQGRRVVWKRSTGDAAERATLAARFLKRFGERSRADRSQKRPAASRKRAGSNTANTARARSVTLSEAQITHA